MKNIYSVLFILIFVLALFSDNYAIPAFARKYSMSCQTCHAPFPKLKPYGDEFAGNGFVLADKDAPRYYIETGDPELSLIRDVPIALRAELYGTYKTNKEKGSDFKSPYILKFLSGGSITKNISYYFYFFFSERGEVAGIEDAFVMFNNLFDTDLDLYVGQFQISDPLFKRELRLTLEDYQLYRVKPGYSTAGLTYDRGVMLTYGLETGTDIVVEIVNGTGIGPANSAKNFDNDKFKNFMVRLSQDVGDYFRFGGFGYFGKEMLDNGSGLLSTNRPRIYGGDFTAKLKDVLELNTQYTYRTDTEPIPGIYFNDKIKTEGLMTELIYTPKGDESKIYGVGMFNYVFSDFSDLNYRSATLHLGYLLKRNVRIIGEFTYNLTKEYGVLSTGIIAAF